MPQNAFKDAFYLVLIEIIQNFELRVFFEIQIHFPYLEQKI